MAEIVHLRSLSACASTSSPERPWRPHVAFSLVKDLARRGVCEYELVLDGRGSTEGSSLAEEVSAMIRVAIERSPP